MPLTAKEAWDALNYYKIQYYNDKAAMYSGDPVRLSQTGRVHTFWKRSNCNCRVHVPIAADIAATSADLLFGQPPKITVDSDGEGKGETAQQQRLDVILQANTIDNRLTEAAETAAAFGDVYLKLRWNAEAACPFIDVAQPDAAWPEYLLGELSVVHFFTPLKIDYERDVWLRIYERYTRGKIEMELYRGNTSDLGQRLSDAELEQYGFRAVIETPTDDLLVAHIANMRPNRMFRNSMLGRSDMDDLRDLCDALDETYSSWIRDIRLGKARMIVPAEYLRKRKVPTAMDDGLTQAGYWEFDTDVETYVAMDINPDETNGNGITQSQFAIRAAEHAATCSQIIADILTHAGYSPQTFGLNINGSAQSGTALNIREKKSVTTRNKKQTYWQVPLENILTALVRLDAALYPGAGSVAGDSVSVEFADGMGADINTLASAAQMLSSAQAASTETLVAMLHPDWTPEQQAEEVDLIRRQNATELEPPIDAGLGDLEK